MSGDGVADADRESHRNLSADSAGLAEQWETMSEHYLPGRRQLVDALVDDLSARFSGQRVGVVELGSGPGSLLRRLAAALRNARVVGVEIDPVLAHVHQAESSRRGVVPVPIVDADLSEPEWATSVGTHDVSAVVAVQVMHYFGEPRFAALVSEIHRFLPEGGIFMHLDAVPRTDAGQPQPAAEAPSAGADPWSSWWAAARCDPTLDAAFARRQRRLAEAQASAEFRPDEAQLRRLLREGGFGDVRPLMRVGDGMLTVACRTS